MSGGYEATFGFISSAEQEQIEDRLANLIGTHPSLSLIISYLRIRPLRDVEEAKRLAEQNKNIEDLDKEVDRWEKTAKHHKAKLEVAEKETRELRSKLEAVSTQLEKLAQHKEVVFIPAAQDVFDLQQRNLELKEELQAVRIRIIQLEDALSRDSPELARMREVLRHAEGHNEFLIKIRDENGARIIEQRERIWELEKGIAPELVALKAELEFWRTKAKSFLLAR